MDPDRSEYWNGRHWTATRWRSGGGYHVEIRYNRWRRIWLGTARLRPIYRLIGWFNCSVPVFRGHLEWLQSPKELREANRDNF